MNARLHPDQDVAAFPLLSGDAGRVFAWRGSTPVSAAQFLGEALTLAETLDGHGHVLNLCEDRYRFLLGFAAALISGLPTLLPPSRSPATLTGLVQDFDRVQAIGDADSICPDLLARLPVHCRLLPLDASSAEPRWPAPDIAADSLAAVGFTSGSTGAPMPQQKYWGSLCTSNLHNATALWRCLREAGHGDAAGSVVATVPAQHMWGMEASVLLPLRTSIAVHSGRPFFPADIAQALAELPPPRVLVTTPVHLKTLVGSKQPLPELAVILCAAAPLSPELAKTAEATTGARVLEMFGSTETCVFASRRTAVDDDWTAYPGVCFEPSAGGTRIGAGWLRSPVVLPDHIDADESGHFRVLGRSSDHLEIAGKRASLAGLTASLQALDGVLDAVVFAPDDGGGEVQRLAALAVAPTRSEAALLKELRQHIDPLFLPRPLRIVDALPRNATGKLPRAALLATLGDARCRKD
ncbi:MAG: acyl-CoA synthetase [Xanthomonadales bacterium]|nr:acyl-CoA synthetase [Xanthomonadales bacterium]